MPKSRYGRQSFKLRKACFRFPKTGPPFAIITVRGWIRSAFLEMSKIVGFTLVETKTKCKVLKGNKATMQGVISCKTIFRWRRDIDCRFGGSSFGHSALFNAITEKGQLFLAEAGSWPADY